MIAASVTEIGMLPFVSTSSNTAPRENLFAADLAMAKRPATEVVILICVAPVGSPHDGRAVAVHHLAHGVARPREPRHDGAERHVQGLGDLLIAQAFETYQQENLPLLVRKRRNGAREIPKLERGWLRRRTGKAPSDPIELDWQTHPLLPRQPVDIGIVHNAEKIRARVTDAAPMMAARERADQRLLDELFGFAQISQENSRISPKIGNVSHDRSFESAHDDSLLKYQAAPHRGAHPFGEKLDKKGYLRRCRPGVTKSVLL
jgi:hypothetical protein